MTRHTLPALPLVVAWLALNALLFALAWPLAVALDLWARRGGRA